ncbi:MAG: dynamin family protein, partial [Methylococcaceae bacterium]
MTTPASVLAELLSSLPPQYHQPVQLLAAATLQSDTPLRLTLVGAFSVGKSSLLNMLIGETLLPAALEETTALPTFIEYGSFRSLQQLQQDGTLIPLNDAAFTAAAIQAPEGAACAVVTLPLDWLHGISIIDLPGLGSLSATHRAYTLSQIRAADMVLYLIGSRGPSQDDIALLTEVHQAGKRVRLMVTQWDMIEAAVARGEKAPSLAQWATQIEAATGLKLQLEPCSRFGLGREAIQSFLHEAQKDTAAIRLRRFRAEVSPILHNALGQNSDSQRSCEAQSEDALRALHEQLMQRKQALIELKSGLYAQQREDRERIEQLCASPLNRERQTLAQNLQEQAGQIKGEQDWDTFGEQGSGLLKTALAAVAGVFSQVSHEYGQLDLPEAQINAFNLRLPQPESVAAEDFLDIGQLTRLQQELARQQATFKKLEEKLSGLRVIDTYVEEQELFTLMQQRQVLANQPLPCIIQEINTGNGGGVGRMIGDVLDVGLLFVNPATAATKVAAILGKVARVEKAVSITLKTVQALKNGEQVGMIPQPVMQKLGYLVVLS